MKYLYDKMGSMREMSVKMNNIVLNILDKKILQ